MAEAYDAHGAAVLAFSRRLVGDPAAAQDLTQEVFLTLPKVARRFEERASLRSFLLSIAVNHARHHVRAASRPTRGDGAFRARARRCVREPGPAPLLHVKGSRTLCSARSTICLSISASRSCSARSKSAPPSRWRRSSERQGDRAHAALSRGKAAGVAREGGVR
ncbi:MAG: sigma-70 family RNA polymerase sigma factor [Polyangiales bacterium]